jgi:predicted aspartyl protease
LNGSLDESNEAFLAIDFGQGTLDFLIDTGFSGSLVIGDAFFDESKATFVGTIEAELAAGQIHKFRRFELSFGWFERKVLARVLLGPGKECLVGTQLLNPHRLEIDYERREVRLIPSPTW